MTFTRLSLQATALVLSATLLSATPALAAAPQPAAAAPAAQSASRVVLATSERVLATLDRRRAEFSKDREALRSYVNGEFDAVFDRDYSARQVLGRHQRGAAAEDVRAFGDALTDNLLAKYGSTLLSFNGGIKVAVLSESTLPRDFGVLVKTELRRPGAEPLPVDYFMRRAGAGWKIYDVSVAGVSMVQTFRKQFDAELQRKSIRQVVAELRGGQIKVDSELK